MELVSYTAVSEHVLSNNHLVRYTDLHFLCW